MKVPDQCNQCQHLHKSSFNALPPNELDRVSKGRTCVQFKKGQTIYHEGMRVNGLYCIHAGIAKLSKLGPKGKDQIIKFMHPGELAGYRSMVAGDPVNGTLVAHTEVHGCFIPRELFFGVLEDNYGFSLEVLKRSCHELGEFGKVITHLAQKSVKERLAELLLMLEVQFGENLNGFIDVKLSREEMANMVGTATESLIRLLSDFKKEGLIETEGKYIRIADKGGLIQLAELME